MNALKPGQGAAKAAPEPTRTPERQALAQAIANREYVAGLVEAKRASAANFQDRCSPIYTQQAELERQLTSAPTTEQHRLDALLRGEDPQAGVDRDAIKAQIADLKAQVDGFWELQRQAEADALLLESDLQMREMEVRECVRKVVRADPAQAAVTVELLQLNARRALLSRAADQALNEYAPGDPERHNSSLGIRLVPAPHTPCPWAEAKARLLTDPDAVLPMPADV